MAPVKKKKDFNVARVTSLILNYSQLRVNGDEGTGGGKGGPNKLPLKRS